jgi:putative peptidoglycan lipid II flippase
MSLIKSGLAVASGTTMSRISGFMRDILVAKYLGATDSADIWVAAFRFPNMFRRIIAEGAFSAAFFPVYSEVIDKKGIKAGDLFSGRVLSRMSLIIIIGIVLCQLLMPYLIYLIAPGYSEDFTNWLITCFNNIVTGEGLPSFPTLHYSEKMSLAITLTIICLPYAGFMFLAAIQSAILNYHNKFMIASMLAVILNGSLMVALLASTYFDYSPLMGMGWASCVAGLLQSVILYAVIKKSGLKLRLYAPKKDDDIKKFIKLLVPGMISGGVTQINILIGSIVASFSAGAMAYLYYADRIYQLPLSIIGVSLSIVLLPTLVKSFQQNTSEQTQKLISRAIEFSCFTTLPAAFALIVVPDSVVAILFEIGKFTSQDTQITGLILLIYGLGLPAFVGIKLFSPVYFARHDTNTPMVYASWSILINIIALLGLFPFINFYAIPISSIISGWYNFIKLFLGLYKQDIIVLSHNSKIIIFKIIMACCVMTLFLICFKYYFVSDIQNYRRIIMIFMLLMGMSIYFITSYYLNVIPMEIIKKYLKK